MLQLSTFTTLRVGQFVRFFDESTASDMSGTILGFNPDGSLDLTTRSGVPAESLILPKVRETICQMWSWIES